MEPKLLDAAFVIALETSDDQNHRLASQYWLKFQQSSSSLITTSFILDEIATFFNSRDRHKKAVEVIQNFLNSEIVELIHVDEPLFYSGWEYFQKHSDKRYSLTDCISFVVMTDRKLTTALTFDKHFSQAGFEKLPHS
ncbi:MAG: PIN domain-containing protein [Pyrinomonadaceae bacterium]